MEPVYPPDSPETLASALRRIASGEKEEEELDSSPASPMRRGRRPGAELNVVPLVDVLFLLMVFFVIAGVFGLREGIVASRTLLGGGSGVGPFLPISPIVVEVKAAGSQSSTCFVRAGSHRQEVHSDVELTSELKKLMELEGFKENIPVILATDDEVLWDDVAGRWNAILVAGFHDVGFGRPSSNKPAPGAGS
jgi:biopolymer transport protein ExbD